MEYRVLGLSGLRVSAIGLGCTGMSHAYGAPADRKEMTELFTLAVDMGYTFFDTAEVYGTNTNPHDNEKLLGEDYIRRAHKVCPITAIQNRYSMMARWHENLFPSLEELGIGFVAFSPLANGLLSACYDVKSVFNPQNDYRATMPQFKKESFERNKPLLDLINHLADEHHATPAQISLAWMLQKSRGSFLFPELVISAG